MVRMRRPALAAALDDPGFTRILEDLLAQYRATTLPTSYALDQRAQVTPAAIDAALQLWAEGTPAAAPQLDQEQADSPRRKAALLAFVAFLGARMAGDTRRFRDGDLTLAAWLDAHLTHIQSGIILAGLAAYGGRSAFEARGTDIAAQQTRQQYGYAAAMAADVLEGRQRQNGRLDARAALYAGSVWVAYQAITRRNQAEDGARWERNVLGDTDESCPDCLGEADQDWVPIGTLSAPGTRRCGPNCRCDIETTGSLP